METEEPRRGKQHQQLKRKKKKDPCKYIQDHRKKIKHILVLSQGKQSNPWYVLSNKKNFAIDSSQSLRQIVELQLYFGKN